MVSALPHVPRPTNAATSLVAALTRGVAAVTVFLASCSPSTTSPGTTPEHVSSPDGRLDVQFHLDGAGAPRYRIEFQGQAVLGDSRLGLVRDDADFSQRLELLEASAVEPVTDRYTIQTAKRRDNEYRGNRRTFRLQTASGQKLEVIFQVSNDGVAFRYAFPASDERVHRLKEEATSFNFQPGTRAWLQPIAVAQSGWSRVNPSFEEYYLQDIPVGTPSPMGAGWMYPALFKTGDTWLLVSETGLDRSYSGTRLRSCSWPDERCRWVKGEYTVGLPDLREVVPGGTAKPESTLPWLTPWRLIVVGDLQTVTESMLGVDLARPPATATTSRPGKASWSWPLLGDSQTTYEVQKQFIDYAHDMGWQYCLIDALWDKQIGYERTQELVDYARGKSVDLLLWYNSAGAWNSAPQTPRDVMLTHETRVQEFGRLKAMGVAGLKIDFFGGDGQSMIAYYLDILEDAAPYGLLLNFHGATLPRGWQRTYPHLMTMEAVRGLEYVTFEQAFAEQEANHATMLPFTRNVFDPMDFTPAAMDRINDWVHRRTTSAFELATTILFTSGIQHYAETPSGMAKAPEYVREFLRQVPSVWDEVKFVDGYPGKFVVLARRGEGRWYVAGINGEDNARTLRLDLNPLVTTGSGALIADGDGGNLSFRRETIEFTSGKTLEVTLPARGGFVLVTPQPP